MAKKPAKPEPKGKVGQPLKFETPDALKKVLDAYFKETPFEQWTMTGLALAAGSKKTLQNYQAKPEYTEIVDHARLRVENSYEVSLRTKACTGAIFALKNMGWSDKQEIETDGKLEIVITNYAD